MLCSSSFWKKAKTGGRPLRALAAVCVFAALFAGRTGLAAESAAAQSLRNAVAAGGAATIAENVVLESPLVVPAGKTVTINGSGKLSGTAAVHDLIVVEEGASVAFGGSVELNGAGISGSIVSAKGAVTISDSVTVTGAEVKSAYTGSDPSRQEEAGTGAIEVLKGGSLRLNGGNVTGNAVRSDYCGVIYIADGGSVSIEAGAKIGNNTACTGGGRYTIVHATSGVFLHGGATGSMTGGEIFQNQSMRGAGLMLYSLDEKKRASFTFTGGEIYENKGRTDSTSLESCGAVLVEGNASFIMQEVVSPSGVSSAPVIRDNSVTGYVTAMAKVGAVGGGVCVRDPGLGSLGGQTSVKEFGTEFILNGGKISGNTAYSGGGVYSFSNGVKLQAGVISNNTAIRRGMYGYESEAGGVGGMGGGVYCEGNTVGYSTLLVRDAVITNNTASCQGGGLWFCPTGSATIYAKNGASIHQNDAMGFFSKRKNTWGAGDDLFFGPAVLPESACGKPDSHPCHALPGSTEQKKIYPTVTLSDQAPNGYDVEWYMDGFAHSCQMSSLYNNSLFTLNLNIFPGSSDPRYQAERNPKVSGLENAFWFYDAALDPDHFYALALKCVAPEDVFQKADRIGKLYIIGNKATFGGGIGSNGGVTIGQPGKVEPPSPPQTGDSGAPLLQLLTALAALAGAALLGKKKRA